MSSLLAESGLPLASDESSTQGPLVVAWQNPRAESRQISPVGLLDHDSAGYRFRYIRNALGVEDFQPFLGFDELDRCYVSPWLFPMFAQRVMNPRRPDYRYWLDVLDLPEHATPFEFLARCQGRREGDNVIVISPPKVAGSTVRFEFLVHGVRHGPEPERVEDALTALSDGDTLVVRPQPDNPYDPLAILVCLRDVPVGWVPRLLCPAVQDALRHGGLVGRVLRINGPKVPPHLRLLVEFTGSINRDWDFFAGASWGPLAECLD